MRVSEEVDGIDSRQPQRAVEKLTAAGYIAKETDGSGVKPRTVCKMTDKGREAMQKYVEALKTYFAGL